MSAHTIPVSVAMLIAGLMIGLAQPKSEPQCLYTTQFVEGLCVGRGFVGADLTECVNQLSEVPHAD